MHPERSFRPTRWMVWYPMFALRALLLDERMPADGTIAAFAGVGRKSVVRARQRRGFRRWLQVELEALLRGELLAPAVVAAVEIPVLAAHVEVTREAVRIQGPFLRRQRIRLGHRWFELPAPPPTPEPTRQRDDEPTRQPAVAEAA